MSAAYLEFLRAKVAVASAAGESSSGAGRRPAPHRKDCQG